MTLTVNDTLTAIQGIRVGHAQDMCGITGCTVVVLPDGTVGGVAQRGGAPGTRETDLLRPTNLVRTVTAIVLAGGSAFGLAAADGVMRWCEEQGLGYKTRGGFLVPIVPAAILNDLSIGEPGIRPDAAMGYAACEAATDEPVAQGNVGAGTGCRVAAISGNAMATKGGLGSYAIDLGGGLWVGALVAVNAVGEITDEHGHIMAGLRKSEDGPGFVSFLERLRQIFSAQPEAENTIIGVVATNAALSKEEVNKVAEMAHDGLARAVRPSHTMADGDTIFGIATGQMKSDVNLIGSFGAEAFEVAIRRGVRAAASLGGVRAWNE